MKLEQSFTVAAPVEQVWDMLVDVERVAPCLPGATVTGRNEDGSYNGEFKVKIGPTSAAYSGKLNMESVDEDSHHATMQAAGTARRARLERGPELFVTSARAVAHEIERRIATNPDYLLRRGHPSAA